MQWLLALLSIPLTARLISISSKSLWSSMAATSQRYSAVSDRVALKIRMLAGSLSWALFSKSPFGERQKEREMGGGGWKTLYNCSFKYTAWLHGLKTEFWAKVFQGSIHSAKLWVLRLCFETLCSTGFSKRQFPRGLPAILFWKYT